MNGLKRIVPLAPLAAGLTLGVAASLLFSSSDTPLGSFDGTPSSPQPFSEHAEYPRWDVQVHSRDVNTWDTLQSVNAQHGPDCSAPPASHPVSAYDRAVYVCNNHLMTALRADGYGVIYLTPDRLVDLSACPCVVQWDISTERMSTRDWWDVWITPWEDNLALPFDNGDVDLQGNPRRGIHIDTNSSEGAPLVRTISNYNATQYNEGWNTWPIQQGIAGGTNQAATRQTFRLTITPGHLRFERLASATASALLYFNGSVGAFPLVPSVVQFGHHSYTPTKDGAGIPGTWHWDNMSVSPAVPFTMVKAGQRVATNGQTVHFGAPAPADAYLRFSAIGTVRVNGQVVAPQKPAEKFEHFSSYFFPVAEGTTQVTFSFSNHDWYTGPFRAKDIAIWSLEGGEPSTPTPSISPSATASASPLPSSTPSPLPSATATSSPSPTPTPTAIAPTATASSTPDPTATSSPIPTASPSPIPTSTPTADRCYVLRVPPSGAPVWQEVAC